MAETDIAKTVYGDANITEFSVDAQSVDDIGENKENRFDQVNWSKYFGYYKKIPELAAAIDARATWTVGKGFRADTQTTFILDELTGCGTDSFNTIIENMIRTYNIGGDAFAEIIRDDNKRLINLKPLNPERMVIISNKQGQIIRYEERRTNGKKGFTSFKPEEIFHLSRNRVANEVHGQSLIEQLETIILMRNEAMDDMKKLMHRHVKPVNVFKLDTDDEDKISSFKSKADAVAESGENLYIPMGAVEQEIISIPQNATLSPLSWIESLNQYFWQATGGTDVVIGATQGVTEAAMKIKYLAYQQSIEEEQLYIEEQVGKQLGLFIELDFPASLENELLSDNKKDKESGFKRSDTTAGSGQ